MDYGQVVSTLNNTLDVIEGLIEDESTPDSRIEELLDIVDQIGDILNAATSVELEMRKGMNEKFDGRVSGSRELVLEPKSDDEWQRMRDLLADRHFVWASAKSLRNTDGYAAYGREETAFLVVPRKAEVYTILKTQIAKKDKAAYMTTAEELESYLTDDRFITNWRGSRW